MSSKIFLIRHSTTEGNQKRWFYGATDLPLAKEGLARLDELKEEGIYPEIPEGAQIFTSGLRRTEETLKELYGELPHGVISELEEMNFGEYECKNYDELKGDKVFEEWGYDMTGDITLPGGESRNAFTARVIEGGHKVLEQHRLQDLSVRHNGKDSVTLVVCHGGVISTIMDEWFPGEKESMWHWMTQPGCGYTIYTENGKPVSHELIGYAEYSNVITDAEEGEGVEF